MRSVVGLLVLSAQIAAGQSLATLHIEVRSEAGPVRDADVVIAGKTYETNAQGAVMVAVSPGHVDITVVKAGFVATSASVDLQPAQQQAVVVELTREVTVEEHVTVSATRTNRGIEDQPIRVEVIDPEEIDEKSMMTPGNVVMLLNETAGMRVQATSPSLGAASIRLQGMRGRYTRFLSDGLPLFGEQVSLGLMQIPPLDLGRVEVIKGVASSLYGAGAMSGVVNLVSRRPGTAAEHQVVLNASTRGGTDAALWYSAPLSDRWGVTFMGSANGQARNDVNNDGWADLPRYERVVARPRVFWDDHAGTLFFATVGGTWENRTGGTLPGDSLPAGGSYIEALDTRRTDAGAAFQTLSASGWMWSLRGSWSTQHQDHQYGDVRERDDHATGVGEVTARRAIARHTLVAGVAVERDAFRPVDTPQFAYTYTTPGIFVQDDVDLARWFALSASARLDHQSTYGAFLSPRISALVRSGAWSSRLSYGTGFFAPSAITEETEAAGLSRLSVDGPLKAERGQNTSVDLTRKTGPLSTTLTVFHSRIADPVDVEQTTRFVLRNLATPSTNAGLEGLAVWKTEDFSLVASYTYIRSREDTEQGRAPVPLTPSHTGGVDGAWDWGEHDAWHLGLEWYYTGRQRVEANPYRAETAPYNLYGMLFSRRIGKALLFINGENLGNINQTDWDPLLRPARGVDGRWTVDAWAPLDGRVINGGVRISF